MLIIDACLPLIRYRHDAGALGVTKGKLLPTRLQLDLDTDTPLSTATTVLYPVDVACGANHSVAVLSDGSVLGWGHRYATIRTHNRMCLTS